MKHGIGQVVWELIGIVCVLWVGGVLVAQVPAAHATRPSMSQNAADSVDPPKKNTERDAAIATQAADIQAPVSTSCADVVKLGQARAAVCQTTVTLFVTHATFSGNLGGLAGADTICQAAAQNAALPGEFRAWLSTAAAPAGTRHAHKTVPYVMPGGIKVANDYADLVDGELAHPINRTEFGLLVQSPIYVRTGTTPDGQMVAPTCHDWTSTRRYDVGWSGDPRAATSKWSRFFLRRCDKPAHLYCVER